MLFGFGVGWFLEKYFVNIGGCDDYINDIIIIIKGENDF